MARRCTVFYSDAMVDYAPLFVRSFSFPWEAIVSAKYSVLAQWWVFQLSDGRKVRVSIYINGHRDFLEMVRQRLAIPIPDANLPGHVQP